MPRGRGGCLQGIRGVGLNIFFRGRNAHQVIIADFIPDKLAGINSHGINSVKNTSGRNGQERKSAQRGRFWDGYPADIRGSFARISRPKTSVRVLKTLEKNKLLGADIHDPEARTSTTLRA